MSSKEDLPPPYTPAPSLPTTTISPHLLSTHLATHLTTLPSRIRATASAHATAQQATDLALVTLLVPHIESFLSDLGTCPPPQSSSRGPVTQKAELTLVPAKAAPAPWMLSGAAERRREGESVSLVRVEEVEALEDGEKGGKGKVDEKRRGEKERTGDRSRSPEKDYSMDAWGRWDDSDGEAPLGEGAWWFADEAMAKRLAGYLSPARAEPVRVERTAVAEAVREEKSSRWGFGRKKEPAPGPSVMVPVKGKEVDDEKVVMTVRAEEVAFQRENDMGMWESISGWGLVVRVRMRA